MNVEFHFNMMCNWRMLNKPERVKKDAETIQRLGGPSALAARLGYKVQRVGNWVTRGIPPREQLNRPDVFIVGGAGAGTTGSHCAGDGV